MNLAWVDTPSAKVLNSSDLATRAPTAWNVAQSIGIRSANSSRSRLPNEAVLRGTRTVCSGRSAASRGSIRWVATLVRLVAGPLGPATAARQSHEESPVQHSITRLPAENRRTGLIPFARSTQGWKCWSRRSATFSLGSYGCEPRWHVNGLPRCKGTRCAPASAPRRERTFAGGSGDCDTASTARRSWRWDRFDVTQVRHR